MREFIVKFHKGKENLDSLLVSQRPPLLRQGLGFNECSTSYGTSNTIFVKSSSPPQTSSVDIAKTKDRKPKSKQGSKPSSGSMTKRNNTSQDKPKSKLISKGQTSKKHDTKQKTLSKRTSSPNVQCHYCMKHGHINIFCRIRREQLCFGTFVDSNHQGPKLVWVPKTKN